jgi:hypothetical protein
MSIIRSSQPARLSRRATHLSLAATMTLALVAVSPWSSDGAAAVPPPTGSINSCSAVGTLRFGPTLKSSVLARKVKLQAILDSCDTSSVNGGSAAIQSIVLRSTVSAATTSCATIETPTDFAAQISIAYYSGPAGTGSKVASSIATATISAGAPTISGSITSGAFAGQSLDTALDIIEPTTMLGTLCRSPFGLTTAMLSGVFAIDASAPACTPPAQSVDGHCYQPASIYEVRNGIVPVGSYAVISNALVEASTPSTAWILSAPGDSDYDGPANSGAALALGAGVAAPAQGSRVTVYGQVNAHGLAVATLTQATAITVTGSSPLPPAYEFTSLNDPNFVSSLDAVPVFIDSPLTVDAGGSGGTDWVIRQSAQTIHVGNKIIGTLPTITDGSSIAGIAGILEVPSLIALESTWTIHPTENADIGPTA